ncbi:carboxymuconolactone decarboxylase family protein [Streptomyces sp. NBC_00588]|uniref:carboxymuconolactone decarboxylase family protein n=1 Tax=Streptomyces sp. NBC_00588 TaxID=2975784 RepID=UPI002E80CEDF|nr:carboxymuconolactone decarboxylase family protein [Streptomyces sp. NBC_00588]WUB33490.1 carboxymuconolactone decarboxylase family protein [Streptomyces sp. NBC_00588]
MLSAKTSSSDGSHRPVGGGGSSRRRSGSRPAPVELLRIRTSQINGCAFCLRMHTRDALKKGADPDRIAVLLAWEETGYFSETDRAAVRLTEAITCVPDGHVSNEDYDAAADILTADQNSAAGGREIPRTTRCGWRRRGLVELL